MREFVYIDTQKVIDLLSSIENGLPTEMGQIQRELGSEVGGKLSVGIATADLRRKREESETREQKTMTPASIFNRLYESLEENKLIRRVEADTSLDSLQSGDVLEVSGKIEVSSMDAILELFKPFMKFARSATTRQAKSPRYPRQSRPLSPYEVFELLLQRPTFAFRVIAPNGLLCIGTGSKKYLQVSQNELEGRYKVLSRIHDFLKENEKFDLFRFPGGLSLPSQVIEQMIQSFPQDIANLTGMRFAKEDFQAIGPALIVSPIAFYI